MTSSRWKFPASASCAIRSKPDLPTEYRSASNADRLKLFGVNIVVDVSWLFIFAIVSWALGGSAGPFHAVDVSPGVRALLAVVTALLFFVSVLLHELAHSLVARSQGIPVKEIRLFIFGGASNLTEEPKAPLAAAWLAFAGPLLSLVLAVICGLVAMQVGILEPAGVVLAYLATANLIVGIFNPAAGVSDGRRPHLSSDRLEDHRRPTMRATRIGRARRRRVRVADDRLHRHHRRADPRLRRRTAWFSC